LGLIAFLSMTFAVFLQVVLRAFDIPMTGADEFERYLLIFLVYISLAYAARTSGHIKVDFVQEKMPRVLQKIVRNFVNILTTCVFAAIMISALITISTNLANKTPTLGIPFIVFFFPTVLGFILATIQSVQHTIKEFTN
jgi:TRAP-type C4-dicarboxylate transport system permease small subunit